MRKSLDLCSDPSRHVAKQVSAGRNSRFTHKSARGLRAWQAIAEFAERWPAQGVFVRQRTEPGITVLGIRVKRPMANSSTVIGPTRN